MPVVHAVAFDDVTVEIRDADSTVVARRGAATVPLSSGHAAGEPRVSPSKHTITFDLVSECSGDSAPTTLTFDQVRSQLDVADGDYAAAVAHDPDNRVAAIDLASSQQRAGDGDAAVRTLAPWLAREPVAMYATVVATPDLSPLLAVAALAKLRAARPGDVEVAPAAFTSGIAFAPDRDLLAVSRSECSWGASDPDACSLDIEIFDIAHGSRIAVLPLHPFGEATRSATRASAAQRTLRDLGFVAETTVDAVAPAATDAPDATLQLVFPALHLGIVEDDNGTEIVRRDRVLEHAYTLDRLHGASYAPRARVVVLFSGRAGHEGCEGTNPTMTTVVRVAP